MKLLFGIWYSIYGGLEGAQYEKWEEVLTKEKKKKLADKFIMTPKAKFVIINYKEKTLLMKPVKVHYH